MRNLEFYLSRDTKWGKTVGLNSALVLEIEGKCLDSWKAEFRVELPKSDAIQWRDKNLELVKTALVPNDNYIDGIWSVELEFGRKRTDPQKNWEVQR